MTHILWSQDVFSKGELSPLMYARVTLQAYYQGLRRAKNVICFPQGAAGKRFGTIYQFTVSGESNYKYIYFKSFQYLNECCYLIIVRPGFIEIYLEGYHQFTVISPIKADEIQLIDHTILENRFRITTGIYRPKDLKRSFTGPLTITGFTSSTLQITGPFNPVPAIYPVRFTGATMPTTLPQIHVGKTYFIRAISTTDFKVYTTAEDAAADINSYAISSLGVAGLAILNLWTFTDVVFKNLPQFDFQNPSNLYETSTFTPAGVTGYGILLTRTAGTFNFTSNYVGGTFQGNDGLARIVAVNGSTTATLDIAEDFKSTAAIPGTQALITEPAWNDILGWPRKCSSYQNRAFFANTDTISNGLWGSYTNQFDNFNDLEDDTDDDAAISWRPTSDTVNYIQFIVPYRSLTIHSNSGVFSTPLSIETAITPTNFSLSLQDSTPADFVQPAGIDNQIIVLSGNDAHSLLWDGFNNAYTSNIISIANEQLIRNPIDEAPYVDKIRAGSRYMFIVNDDGTLAIYQSLIGENVSGFTEAELEQSYGNSYFRSVTSNFDGRAWFLTERQIAEAIAIKALTVYTPVLPETGTDIFTAATHGIGIGITTAVKFSTTGILLTSTPQININDYYWAVPIDANTFKVYLSQVDAEANENAIIANLIPINNSITPWALTTKLMVEQLSFDVEMDCVGLYPTPLLSAPTSAISGQPRFNAQELLMQGDGFGFETTGVNDTVNFEAYGVTTAVSEAQYGFPIHVEITPLPISLSMTGNPKSSNLIEPKHLRYATFLLADTVGGSITQDGLTFPIAMKDVIAANPGGPPIPQTGSFEISVFGGWDDFKKSSFTINHTEAFGIKLTGIFYMMEA